MNIDVSIFDSDEKFHHFLKNSVLQFIKLKFGSKQGLLSYIQNKFGLRINSGATYEDIVKILADHSINFYQDIFSVSSPIEIAHLYSFYKVITDVLWETTWTKRFSPLYYSIYGKKLKIKKKTELRKIAARIITGFSQDTLIEKWISLSSSGIYAPVMHYKHLTIGPLGFLFSLYYKEKELFTWQEPLLTILITSDAAGEEIINWEESDLFTTFSVLVNAINKKFDKICSEDHTYGKYLKYIGFAIPPVFSKKNLRLLAREFKKSIKQNKIPIAYHMLSQLSAMFLHGAEAIKLINKVIAEDGLIIQIETEVEDYIITEDGIIKKPKSWLATPAFELAQDLSSVGTYKDTESLITTILQKGAIKYLELLFEEEPEVFKKVCEKRGLYKYAKYILQDKSILPKEKVIRLLLESYGLEIPSKISLQIRQDIVRFLASLKEFKTNYTSLEEDILIERIATYMHNGRKYLEHLLKEWLFIIIALILHYQESLSREIQLDKIFLIDRPVLYISPYDREREIRVVKRKYVEFMTKLRVPKDLKRRLREFFEKRRSELTLGDWYAILKHTMKFIDETANLGKKFWNVIPECVNKNFKESSSIIEEYFLKEKALKWLNIASHAEILRELRERTKSRVTALNVLRRLDEIIVRVLEKLPILTFITRKVTELDTGLEFYEAECFGEDKFEVKIYGSRFIGMDFPYYMLSRIKQDNIAIYPVLITNLLDEVL